MKVTTAFRNLDSHGQHRAPEVINEERAKIEEHVKRFHKDLVRLDVTVSQTKGKKRIHASLRLQLPSGLIAAQEEGFEVEPVIRKAFADLRKRLDRHLARLKHEPEWKRPARRARLGALLEPAANQAEADRRSLYFDLIEDHLDKVYDAVRRELIYLEADGVIRPGRLSVRAMVDAAVLAGLDQFEKRPTEFSVGDWLTRLAFEAIGAEARAARRSVPDDAASLVREPEVPAEEPTESDQEMFEFYQPDDVLLLEDLVSEDVTEEAEAETARREAALALHRAMAGLPALWRKVLIRLDFEEDTPEQAAVFLDIPEEDVTRIAKSARAFLREKLLELGIAPDNAEYPLEAARNRSLRIPQPLEDRSRIQAYLSGERQGDAA